MDNVSILDKTFSLLIDPEQIERRIQQLALDINNFYEGEEVVLLPVLSGAFLFAADLCRKLAFSPEVEFIKVSSYGGGATSTGKLTAHLAPTDSVKGRRLLLVEDIVDSGLTSDYLRNMLASFQPASVAMATLLYKPDCFRGIQPPEFVGFEIPPTFVVGYGLDYAGKGRALRGIYAFDG